MLFKVAVKMFRGALSTVVPCGARGVHAAWRVALRCRPRPRCREGTPGGEGPLGRRRRAGVTPSPAPLPRAEGSHGSSGIEWRGSSDGLCPGALLSPAGRGTVASGLGTFPGSTAPCGRVRLPARPVLTREPEFQKYTRESRLFPRRCGVVRVGGEAAPWSPARPPWAPGRVRRGSPGARRVRLDDRPCAVREGCHPGGHGLGCTLGQHSQLCGPGGSPRVPGWSSRDTFQELEGLEQRSSYRRAPTSCSRTPPTGRDEAPMLTDAVRRSGGLAPRCWLWFPGKELGVPPARGARCL